MAELSICGREGALVHLDGAAATVDIVTLCTPKVARGCGFSWAAQRCLRSSWPEGKACLDGCSDM